MSSPATTFRAILSCLRGIVADVAARSVPAQNALLTLAYIRLGRAASRFQRLFECWQSGSLPVPRPPRPAKPRAKRPPPEIRLPRGRMWLLARLKSTHANRYSGQLAHLLTDPQMPAFLAAAPQAGRVLRPLCHMLGLDVPTYAALPTKPRPPRKPRPKRERPEREKIPPRPRYPDYPPGLARYFLSG